MFNLLFYIKNNDFKKTKKDNKTSSKVEKA